MFKSLSFLHYLSSEIRIRKRQPAENGADILHASYSNKSVQSGPQDLRQALWPNAEKRIRELFITVHKVLYTNGELGLLCLFASDNGRHMNTLVYFEPFETDLQGSFETTNSLFPCLFALSRISSLKIWLLGISLSKLYDNYILAVQ